MEPGTYSDVESGTSSQVTSGAFGFVPGIPFDTSFFGSTSFANFMQAWDANITDQAQGHCIDPQSLCIEV